MLLATWTAGLDVPRHTTAEPEQCGLAAAAGSRTSRGAWRHGTAAHCSCSTGASSVFTCQSPLPVLLTRGAHGRTGRSFLTSLLRASKPQFHMLTCSTPNVNLDRLILSDNLGHAALFPGYSCNRPPGRWGARTLIVIA